MKAFEAENDKPELSIFPLPTPKDDSGEGTKTKKKKRKKKKKRPASAANWDKVVEKIEVFAKQGAESLQKNKAERGVAAGAAEEPVVEQHLDDENDNDDDDVLPLSASLAEMYDTMSRSSYVSEGYTNNRPSKYFPQFDMQVRTIKKLPAEERQAQQYMVKLERRLQGDSVGVTDESAIPLLATPLRPAAEERGKQITITSASRQPPGAGMSSNAVKDSGLSSTNAFLEMVDPSVPQTYETVVLPEEMNQKFITGFTPSSRDEMLVSLARENACRLVASTSSISSLMVHMHYAFCGMHPANMSRFSPVFEAFPRRFTRTLRRASTVVLRKREGNVWAIDGMPSGGGRSGNVLMELGKSWEQIVTNEEDTIKGMMKTAEVPADFEIPDVYRYTKFQDFLLRSQLDAAKVVDGAVKVFDIKTRACNPIRMDVHNYKWYKQFKIQRPRGAFKSWEREWYDMVRSTFIKYNFQCRIGQMDGVFIAYHNTQDVLGYQYVSLDEIHDLIYGSTALADLSFSAGLQATNKMLTALISEYDDDDVLLVTLRTCDESLTDVHVERLPPNRPWYIRKALEGSELSEEEIDAACARHWLEIERLPEETILEELEQAGLSTDGPPQERCRRLEEHAVAQKRVFMPKSFWDKMEADGYLRRFQLQLSTYSAKGKLIHNPTKTPNLNIGELKTYISFFDAEPEAAMSYYRILLERQEADLHSLEVRKRMVDFDDEEEGEVISKGLHDGAGAVAEGKGAAAENGKKSSAAEELMSKLF